MTILPTWHLDLAVTDFLTGFPGFIGRRLVRGCSTHDATAVVALVEPRMADTAARLAGGRAPGDPHRGHRRARGSGSPTPTGTRLAGEVTHVFHLAAIYDLAVPLELAQRVNVDGTGNVLELCLAPAPRAARLREHRLRRGQRTGVVYEHELVLGQGFKNHYESTKFQAEVWVARAARPRPDDDPAPGDRGRRLADRRDREVRRPLLHAARDLPASETDRPIVAVRRAPDAPFNVVPVDFVVDAIAAGAADPAAAGETLHLVDPEPLTAQRAGGAARGEYAGRAPSGRVPPRLVEASCASRPSATLSAARRASRSPTSTIRSVRHPPRGRPARPARPEAAACSGTTSSDGALLPRARGRPRVQAEAIFVDE